MRSTSASATPQSQGSEYPAVIVVLHRSAWRLLERRLLYTVITRARSFCLLVGDQRALARAVENQDSLGSRTALAQDIRDRRS